MRKNEHINKLFEEEFPIEQQPKRDSRSYEMKKMLQQTFPKNKFTVKIHKYSMGESIYIKTDLIKPWTAEDSDNQWKRGMPDLKSITPSMQDTKQKQEYNNEMEKKIEGLLQKFWHIDRDASGEILGGGNTYINVGALEHPGEIIQTEES